MRSSSLFSAVPERVVMPERLDDMAADDPSARRARLDLRRVHRAMRSLSIMHRALGSLSLRAPPRRILELGAGDGSLLLRLARSNYRSWPGVELTLLDRQDLLTSSMKAQFAALGWQARTLCTDALEWAASAPTQSYDLCVTTLFLHHFRADALAVLLTAVAGSTGAFIACEPCRNRTSRVGSHLLGLLGVNDVTREDGITSVAAGFSDHELTALWPPGPAWDLKEYFAWPFTHCFVARRTSESAADDIS